MFHSFWRTLSRTFRSSRSGGARRQSRLGLEVLEDRWMPNGTTIAGFVFNDANNNGIMDSGETGIAGNPVELHRANGDLVATTTTDANGRYVFNTDPAINPAPQTQEVDAAFAAQPTNWSATQDIAQFDPSLGTLTSVEVISQGNLTSSVKVESAEANPIHIGVQVNGQFTLNAAGFGLLVGATAAIDNQTDVGAFDGATDFQGPDSHDFGPKTAAASGSATFDAGSHDLSAFIGTGTIRLSEAADVSSTDSGSGNFDKRIRSQADGSVRIIYHYTPSTGLRPGDYFVKQATEPNGFLDGQTTNDNIHPIPNSFGVNRIDVHLNGTDSLNNNFAEVPPASLSGFVFHDLRGNGVKDPNDPGLSGATVTLTGTDVAGHTMNLTQTTGADGSYTFNNLFAGTNYTITETVAPSGFPAPSVSVGSQGGVAGPGAVTQINLGTGVNGVNNNFGHTLPSSLGGFVYVDVNNQGVKVPGDPPAANVGITLTGTDALGNAVFQTANTAADGSYQFTGLRPGTYTISEAPPPGFIDGAATPGSLGGTAGIDQLFVQVGENQNGVNYNFGLVNAPPPPPPPIVPNAPPIPLPPPPVPPIVTPSPFGKWWFLS
jgi:hypothetical protein